VKVGSRQPLLGAVQSVLQGGIVTSLGLCVAFLSVAAGRLVADRRRLRRDLVGALVTRFAGETQAPS
jgi:hypothetical protein